MFGKLAADALGLSDIGSVIAAADYDIVESFKELNQAAFAWLAGAQQKYWVKDFRFVFERYIKA